MHSLTFEPVDRVYGGRLFALHTFQSKLALKQLDVSKKEKGNKR